MDDLHLLAVESHCASLASQVGRREKGAALPKRCSNVTYAWYPNQNQEKLR